MNHQSRILLLGFVISHCFGCSGTDSKSNSGTGEPLVCPARTTDPTGNLIVDTAATNNYTFSSTLTLKTTTLKPLSDFSIDWSGVTTDFLGHAVNPQTDVGMVSTILWNLTKEQFEQKLNDDLVNMSDMAAGASIFTGGTMTQGDTSIFEIITGGPIKHEDLMSYFDATKFDPATHFYTVMVASGTTPGKGTRMLTGFTLDPNSTNTAITVDSTSTALDYQVDLESLQPIGIPPASTNIVFDWKGLDGGMTAMNQPFDAYAITKARIASYSQSPADLEAKFLDLKTIHSGMWEATVETGTSVAMSAFKSTSSVDPATGEANGPAFTGLEAGKTWILALECGRCSNPAPWYMTILKTCN